MAENESIKEWVGQTCCVFLPVRCCSSLQGMELFRVLSKGLTKVERCIAHVVGHPSVLQLASHCHSDAHNIDEHWFNIAARLKDKNMRSQLRYVDMH